MLLLLHLYKKNLLKLKKFQSQLFGIVGEERDGTYRIEQRNKFSVGETIEVMKPNGENISVEVKRILDEDGNEQESAPHPKQVLYVDLGMPLEQYDILRRQEAKEV